MRAQKGVLATPPERAEPRVRAGAAPYYMPLYIKCRWCEDRAVYTLFDSRDTCQGDFCAVCADRALASVP